MEPAWLFITRGADRTAQPSDRPVHGESKQWVGEGPGRRLVQVGGGESNSDKGNGTWTGSREKDGENGRTCVHLKTGEGAPVGGERPFLLLGYHSKEDKG